MNKNYLYNCPHCHSECLIAAEHTGQTIACPCCQEEFFATAPDLQAQVSLPEKIPFFKGGKLELLKERLEFLIVDGDLSDQDETLLNDVATKLGLSIEDFDKLRDDLFMKEFLSIGKRMEMLCHVSDEDLEAIKILKKKYGVKQFQLDGFASLFRNIYCLEVKSELPEPVKSLLMLDKKETCFNEINTEWIQTRVQKQGYTGFTYSVPSGIKGLRFKFGNYQPVKSEELTALDSGTLTVTNKALIFTGKTRNVTVTYKKVVNLTIFSDALKVDKTTGKDDWFSMNGAQARFIKAIVMYHKSR